MKYKKERAYRKNWGIRKQKIHGNTVNIRKIYKLINCLDTPQGIFKHTLQKNMQENRDTTENATNVENEKNERITKNDKKLKNAVIGRNKKK